MLISFALGSQFPVEYGLYMSDISFAMGMSKQWVHLFLIDFNDFPTIYVISQSKMIVGTSLNPFLMIKSSLSGYTIDMRLLLIERSDAILPGKYCCISIIISATSHCGFPPLDTCITGTKDQMIIRLTGWV